MSQHKVERSDSIVVAALYKFVRLGDYEQLREPLLALMLAQDVRGTLLLANEGINGTIAGPRAGIDTVLGWLREDPQSGGSGAQGILPRRASLPAYQGEAQERNCHHGGRRHRP